MLFGLVHGFGFSFMLQNQLQFAGDHLLLSLLAFNVGIELGQLLCIVVAIPLLSLLFAKIRLSERLVTVVISAFVAHAAWHWLAERWDTLAKVEWPQIDAAVLGLWIALAAALGILAWLMLGQAAVVRRTDPEAGAELHREVGGVPETAAGGDHGDRSAARPEHLRSFTEPLLQDVLVGRESAGGPERSDEVIDRHAGDSRERPKGDFAGEIGFDVRFDSPHQYGTQRVHPAVEVDGAQVPRWRVRVPSHEMPDEEILRLAEQERLGALVQPVERLQLADQHLEVPGEPGLLDREEISISGAPGASRCCSAKCCTAVGER